MNLLRKIALTLSLIIAVFFFYTSITFYNYSSIILAENDNKYVFLGGYPIGIELKCNGVIVERVDNVMTEAGRASLKNYIKPGDNIIALDSNAIKSGNDIVEYLMKFDGKSTVISLYRNGDLMNVEVNPLKEALTSKLRLGIQVKESVLGVGTLTYYKEDGRFGCLGHPICDENGNYISISDGNVYDCRITGVIKGEKGSPGELRAIFTSSKIGSIDKNIKFGVYGNFDNVKEGYKIETGSRADVVPGKAYIYTTVNDKTDFYEAEIIKASYQPHIEDKGMVIRITDSRLLHSTGGVVQGMSGSPIIQNDKLIGAVTHVFINDPTKGYGTYIDWMLEN